MEKFGIFELLDALSAAMESGEKGSSPSEKESSPTVDDKAFAPPSYPIESEKTAALSSLLDRHEKMARRIEGQNKKDER